MAELSEQILQNLMPVGGGLGSKHAKSSQKEAAPKRPGPQLAKAPPKKKFKNETNGPCSR